MGLPAGHVGFRVGAYRSELGVTDRKLAPDGLGTHSARGDRSARVVVMTPLMKRMIGKSNEGFLANLKRLLEGSSA